jgi:glucuronoarabinoxylan endo-1,4-beta-xylanase
LRNRKTDKTLPLHQNEVILVELIPVADSMIKLRLFILCGLFCAFAVKAQTVTNFIDRFDTNSYPANTITNKWSNWFGGAFQSLSLDAASDANNNPASGSMKIVANFPVTTDQFEVWNGINGFSPGISGFQFTNFQCDVRFAAGSATNSSGKFGTLEFGVPTPGYGQNYFGNVAVSASNTNWVHVSIALNATSNTNLQNITGLLIHIWGAGLVGPSTLWVDNLQFVGMTSAGTARIDYNDTHQRIDGFGASSAWMSGTLSTSNADMFFSTNNGIGLSLLRTRIAPDGTSSEGSIAQQAQARGARIWSTPWSPPAIYKGTNVLGVISVNGGSFSNGAANYQGYASLLAKYVKTMTNTYGVPLYALSIQNEPDYNTTNYESCVWTGQQFHDFIPYLSATLAASNVAFTKILFPESESWSGNLALQTTAMNDAAVAPLVGVIANHNYDGGVAAITNYGKALWETEVSTFDAYDGSITNGLYWAGRIHSFLTVAQANAWHFWWLKASGTNNEALTDQFYNPAKRMYVLGNYSKFIRPNFYRVGVTNTTTALVSAYKDSGSTNFVIVAANPTAYAVNQTFTLTNFPAVTRLAPWATTTTNSLADLGVINVTNGNFNFTLPPWSVFSFSSVFTSYPTNIAFGISGTNLTLTWPLTHLGWTLQTQTNASVFGLGNNWTDIANSAMTNQIIVPISPANGSVFYRLRR